MKQVEPQLYGMRWIRLLLGREFHIEDVLVRVYDTCMRASVFVLIAMREAIRNFFPFIFTLRD